MGLNAYNKNLFLICVITPSMLDTPKQIGCNNKILERKITWLKDSGSVIPGKINFAMYGIRKKTMMATITIEAKKVVKTESKNFFVPSFLFSILSLRNGIKTEIETREATEANIKSGILNDA